MSNDKLDKATVRPSDYNSSGFPTSARPVFFTFGFLFVAIIVICIVSVKACGSEQRNAVPPEPEKIKNIVQMF